MQKISEIFKRLRVTFETLSTMLIWKRTRNKLCYIYIRNKANISLLIYKILIRIFLEEYS